MYSIDRLFALTFFTVVFVSSTAAQQPTEILFGTYLPSSPRPEITYHQFNDSNLVNLGFNTIFQTVMHNSIHKDTMLMDPNVWHDNRAALGSSSFSNIVAMNGYWNRKDSTFTQVDWVKILTHSIYNNWEAEGRGDFYSDTIKMERNTSLTTEILDNSIVSIKTRSIEDSSYYTELD
ncbi:MAG: hypothetical protein IPG53_09770 [Ignavibacteriales bacterium]|nr:hypothetical protein [Ignavibacteriales bacterium]